MSPNPPDQPDLGGTEVSKPALAQVGQKVSIRLFEDPADGVGFRDLLGILESPTEVRKKDGSLHSFDPERIFLWKVVPLSGK